MSPATEHGPYRAGPGILLYSAGILFFALNDALGKWLVGDYAVSQILFLRSIGAGIILAGLVWRSRATLSANGSVALHGLRVLCAAADSFAFYYACRDLPLADVMTYYMAAPLIIVALSGPVLGERVGPARWMAVVTGFVGVLIALQPSRAAFSPSALIGLGGAAMFATSATITRKLRSTPWLTLVTYQFIGSGLVGLLGSAFAWTSPSARDVGLMFTVGIVSMASFIAITKALSLVSASLLAPFHYTSIVWAVLLGWLVWGDVPALSTTIGVLVIVGSGLFALYPEPQGAHRDDVV